MDQRVCGSISRAKGWFFSGWAVFAGLLVLLTLVLRSWPVTFESVLGPFDLGRESNVAAWFSASSLLWSGLLLWSAAALLFSRDRRASVAVFVLGVVAIAFSIDEAGSLHERVEQVFPRAFYQLLVALFAALVLPALASVAVLYQRRNVLGQQWALLLVAYGLFGSVFVQEVIGHAVDWPEWFRPVRTVIEEGTELVAFFLLLLASVRLLERSTPDQQDGTRALSLEHVLPSRAALCLAFGIAVLLAPLLILLALSIPIAELQYYKRGNFGSVMMLTMFLIAGGLCLRRCIEPLEDRPRLAWGWLASLCFLLSLLQNWHVYADASALFLGRDPERMWRACIDLVWSLPILIAVCLLVRRQIGMHYWVVGLLAVLWGGCFVAMLDGSFRLSYAVSYLTALVLGGWVVIATRHRPV